MAGKTDCWMEVNKAAGLRTSNTFSQILKEGARKQKIMLSHMIRLKLFLAPFTKKIYVEPNDLKKVVDSENLMIHCYDDSYKIESAKVQ